MNHHERDRRAAGGGASRRQVLKAGGAGVAALGLAGCLGSGGRALTLNPGSPADIPRGGTFTIGTSESPEGVNPLTTSAEDSLDVVDLLNGFGTAVDPIDFGVHPSVFTKWDERNTKTPGEKPAVTFNVRSGLTFSDGVECTVEDVQFTYEYLLEHRPERYESVLDPIESVKRSSSSRWHLQMDLSEPVGTFDSEQLGLPILPKHVWKDIEHPEEYDPTADDAPVGLGPARLTTYEPGSTIELAFREDYPLADLDWIREKDELLTGGPFLNGVRYRVYDDDDALKDAFRKGEVDSMYGSFEADPVDSLLDDGEHDLVHGSDDTYTAFGFNLRVEPFDDLPFRQALGFAFDDDYWTRNSTTGTR